MSTRVLDIFKQSGDAHIGQTMTRLARLAAAAHQYETAMQQAQQGMGDRSCDDVLAELLAAQAQETAR